MSDSRRPLRYRGLSRDRTEGVARITEGVARALGPLLIAVAVGLIAVLRGRDGNIFSGLPLWLVLSIGAGLGLCLWLAHKHADRLFSYVRRRA